MIFNFCFILRNYPHFRVAGDTSRVCEEARIAARAVLGVAGAWRMGLCDLIIAKRCDRWGVGNASGNPQLSESKVSYSFSTTLDFAVNGPRRVAAIGDEIGGRISASNVEPVPGESLGGAATASGVPARGLGMPIVTNFS
jgi:hypothetical protein